MSYDECDNVFGSGSIFWLGDDGEELTFVPVGEPSLVKQGEGKRERDLALFAVASDKGIGAFPVSPARYRSLRPMLSNLKDKAVHVKRSGAKGELDTNYAFELVPMPDSIRAILDGYVTTDIVALAEGAWHVFTKNANDA